ncbi:MAG TPA: hypothetical protein VHA82_02415 [Ramlibacter sp.]|uniref:hypothetical protein n=1 Tax=Ramlibacter sp. TaxID=1917967 RepID=UPI002D02C5B2|nr:hypothetical protein [Ramlibacter sp.]HVZ42636.1 hypothetical protein [Ramlibacter sp.]
MRPKTFATLGPAGSNHDLNTRRYIEFHGLQDARVVFIEDFFEALARMKSGEVDFMIQVCAHPNVALTIEHDYKDIFLVDSFIGTTKAMGVLTRAEVQTPRSLGYMIATRGYFDVSRWPERHEIVSNSAVAQGLLEGRFDSGFTAIELAQQHPGRFRIDQTIGEVDVVWLVYGKERVNRTMLAWRDAPVRAQLIA